MQADIQKHYNRTSRDLYPFKFLNLLILGLMVNLCHVYAYLFYFPSWSVKHLTFSIDNLEAEEMKTRLSVLLKFSVQLAGVSSVLEVLESSFKGTISSQLHDLHLLQESILKTKQVQLLKDLAYLIELVIQKL